MTKRGLEALVGLDSFGDPRVYEGRPWGLCVCEVEMLGQSNGEVCGVASVGFI